MLTYSDPPNPAAVLRPYKLGPKADYTWSACFAINLPNALDIVLQLRDLVHPQCPLSGAITGGGQGGQSLILALDPSRRFGTPSIEQCEEIAAKITQTKGWPRKEPRQQQMRIIMGRRIGYALNGHVYGMGAFRNAMSSTLLLTECDLFSVRYADDGLHEYREPGVIIEGDKIHLDGVLSVAATMGQERLVAEIIGIETQVYERQANEKGEA